MIDIKELKEGTLDELKDKCQKMLDEYQANVVNKILDVQTCNEEEQKVIAECEEFDEYMKDASYNIPNLAQFDGKTYIPKQVYEYVYEFINKQSLEFSYTLGMYELAKFYKQEPADKMLYSVLDSTLHTLNTLQYKGQEDWRKIMVIHNFFMPMHDAYLKDTTLKTYFGCKHNMVVDRIALVAKKDNPETETQN